MMKREELTDALRTEAEWAADHDYDIPLMLCGNLQDAAAMLESDADEIAALKAENERIQQNSVSQEAYQMMCEERDAAVADIVHFCYLCRHRGENQDRCSVCSNLKQEHDYFKWRGAQEEK